MAMVPSLAAATDSTLLVCEARIDDDCHFR